MIMIKKKKKKLIMYSAPLLAVRRVVIFGFAPSMPDF